MKFHKVLESSNKILWHFLKHYKFYKGITFIKYYVGYRIVEVGRDGKIWIAYWRQMCKFATGILNETFKLFVHYRSIFIQVLYLQMWRFLNYYFFKYAFRCIFNNILQKTYVNFVFFNDRSKISIFSAKLYIFELIKSFLFF